MQNETLSGKYRPEEFGGGTVTFVQENPLAFDHGAIIATAFLRILSLDLKRLVFFFLPEKFTLSSYIGVYQYLTGNSIAPGNIPNFRRQLTSTKSPILEKVLRTHFSCTMSFTLIFSKIKYHLSIFLAGQCIKLSK